jgi:predicted nucleic acid-binding protein
MMQKNKMTRKEVHDFLGKMSKIAVITPGKLDIDALLDDPSDNMILIYAVEGGADFIMSVYHHLTDLKIFQGIKIVNPADFLKIQNST